MRKAANRIFILSGVFLSMIVVFIACGLCNKSTFVGNEIADTDFYDIDFEQMNSTHSSVQIYNEDNQLVYKGDDVTDAEFEIQINEKGTYQLYVSGKKAEGHVIFSRCMEEKNIK